MAERWRQPVIPLAIDQLDQGVWLPDGRVQGEVQLTLTEGDVERMRLGYVCAKCLEVFEQAWPERCGSCGAAIRTEQAAYFAREFGGETDLSKTSLSNELAGLDERRRKEEERARANGELR